MRRNEIESRRHRCAYPGEDGGAHPRGRSPQRIELHLQQRYAGPLRIRAGYEIEWVEIRWPSGLTERFADLPVDQIHTLKEGSGVGLESTAKKP